MKKYKFRAWDDVKKKMYYTVEHHNGKGFGTLLFTFNEHMDCDNYKLMQYVGLKDVNKKEIYEGDIVNGGLYNGSYALGVIKYYKNCYYAFPIGRMIEGVSEDFKHFEIVGNIYETPELLKTE